MQRFDLAMKISRNSKVGRKYDKHCLHKHATRTAQWCPKMMPNCTNPNPNSISIACIDLYWRIFSHVMIHKTEKKLQCSQYPPTQVWPSAGRCYCYVFEKAGQDTQRIVKTTGMCLCPLSTCICIAV